MIDLTPLEVRKKKGDFRRAMRGYEPAQVDDFLDIVADRLEQVVREHTALKERVGGLERQVAEYRERERALTDALVTAQTMREEIRVKTTQEVDQLKQRAEADAGTRIQQAQQQAEALRHEAEALLRQAREEAEEQLQRARAEATVQLQSAEHEATRLRTTAAEMRQREEELLRELRERQQQLLASYRGFLERELSEMKEIVQSIEGDAHELPPISPPAPIPAAARPGPVVAAAGLAAATTAPPSAPPASVPPPQPEDMAEAPPPAAAPESSPVAPEATGPQPDVRQAAAPEPAATAPDTVDLEAIIADATHGLATVGLDPLTGEELPPFAPEPVYDEDLLPADDGDDEAAQLLENAERAGYHIELIDDDANAGSELLLEETAPDERDDDDWLSTMIRDEK